MIFPPTWKTVNCKKRSRHERAREVALWLHTLLPLPVNGGQCLRSRPGRLNPEKLPRYPLNKLLSRSGCFRANKIACSCLISIRVPRTFGIWSCILGSQVFIYYYSVRVMKWWMFCANTMHEKDEKFKNVFWIPDWKWQHGRPNRRWVIISKLMLKSKDWRSVLNLVMNWLQCPIL